MKIEGLKEVQDKLKKLGDKNRTRRAMKKAGKASLQPALRMARYLAPKKSGLLAESLGISSARDGENFMFRLEPRRSFRGENIAVADSLKSSLAHQQAGRDVYKGVPPYFYAIIVETGRIPMGQPSARMTDPQLGRKVRTANPFLQKTYTQASSKVPEHFVKNLQQFVITSIT